jgi:4-amino-4-deoxy-L-arabinose transferase-like glycosyltransferase
LCGLTLGLAASAKISFALPALAVAIYLLVHVARGRNRLPDLLALAAGGGLAVAPTLIVFAAAPENFLYGTFFYHTAAPFDWYGANGLPSKLSLAGTTGEFLSHLAAGPVLVMLAVVIATRFLTVIDPAARETRLFLNVVLLATGVAAWLPTPSWPAYIVIMLPPLAVEFGLCLERYLSPREPVVVRRSILACVAVTATFGCSQAIAMAKTVLAHETPVLSMTRQAHWLGEQLAACGAKGRVASFTARWVIDSGYGLDLRFAPGVFVFRSGLLLTAAEARRLNVVVPQTLVDQFDTAPPAAIVTGDQMGTPLFSVRPDRALLDYAHSRGWTRIDHPGGGMSVLVNPRFEAGPCGRAT